MNHVNDYGEIPLHCATKNGHLDICKFISEKVTLNDPADKHGFTPTSLKRVGMGKLIEMLVLMQFELL